MTELNACRWLLEFLRIAAKKKKKIPEKVYVDTAILFGLASHSGIGKKADRLAFFTKLCKYMTEHTEQVNAISETESKFMKKTFKAISPKEKDVMPKEVVVTYFRIEAGADGKWRIGDLLALHDKEEDSEEEDSDDQRSTDPDVIAQAAAIVEATVHAAAEAEATVHAAAEAEANAAAAEAVEAEALRMAEAAAAEAEALRMAEAKAAAEAEALRMAKAKAAAEAEALRMAKAAAEAEALRMAKAAAEAEALRMAKAAAAEAEALRMAKAAAEAEAKAKAAAEAEALRMAKVKADEAAEAEALRMAKVKADEAKAEAARSAKRTRLAEAAKSSKKICPSEIYTLWDNSRWYLATVKGVSGSLKLEYPDDAKNGETNDLHRAFDPQTDRYTVHGNDDDYYLFNFDAEKFKMTIPVDGQKLRRTDVGIVPAMYEGKPCLRFNLKGGSMDYLNVVKKKM